MRVSLFALFLFTMRIACTPRLRCRYAAPEVGSDSYSFSADYYSIGKLLCFMLAGYVPEAEETIDPSATNWEGVSAQAIGAWRALPMFAL